MILRNLGKSGLRVSLVGLGCNNFGQRMDLESSTKVIHKALDAGITLFDTADVYGGPRRLGDRARAGARRAPQGHRACLEIRHGDGRGRKERRLAPLHHGGRRGEPAAAQDRLDRPLSACTGHDPLTPIEETLRALDDLVRAGKVRYIGRSNFSAAQTVEAQWAARHLNLNAFVSAQDEYSLLKRDLDAETLDVMRALRPRPAALLSARLRAAHRQAQARRARRRARASRCRRSPAFMTDANFDIVEKLEAFVKARGHTMLELAFSWLAARPCVASIIAGATKPEQIEANVKATDWTLTAEDMKEIDELTKKV